MKGVRFGLGAPVYPAEEALRAARFADEAGFDGLWIPEYLIRRGDRGLALEPLALLGAAARETRRVHLGTYVLGVQRRHPSMLAFMAASLDHLSGGRLILGLGAGAREMDRSLGIPHGDGTARLREYVEVMRRLWREDGPRYAGTHFQLNGGTLSVRPLQDPLPVWIAAQGPGGMEAAGAVADGWVSNWLYTPEGVGQALGAVRRHAAAAGRDPSALVGAFEAAVAVAETQEEAEGPGLPAVKAKLLKIGGGYAYGYRQLKALGYQGPPPTALDQIPDEVARACSVVGTPRRVIERIEEYARHGVEYFITTFMNPGGEALFAKAVLPHFAGTRTED
ncbi:MAG TPA: LLM class flavin-dependent oxidoreductase [Candidatus Methylomirabilis sp.]|jgi:alkanesulfonate monooxygenase SsuD/methylene tetrahydromethanopterin reductase-like flavin-dependent oxidoreductase (luciferase family)